MASSKVETDRIEEVVPQIANTPDEDAAFEIAEDALGTNLPKHYYWSWQFLGTVVVRNNSPHTSSTEHLV